MRHGKPDIDYGNCNYEDFMEVLSNGKDIQLSSDHHIDCARLPDQIDLICHSDYVRASQTAEIIRSHIKIENILPLELLGEVKFDKKAVLKEQFCKMDEMRPLIIKHWYNTIKDPESFQFSFERAQQIERFIMSRPEQNILFITHGWFLRLLYLYFFKGRKSHIHLKELLNLEAIEFGNFFEIIVESQINSEVETFNIVNEPR
jgi:broad specificity phosphatase PhoE